MVLASRYLILAATDTFAVRGKSLSAGVRCDKQTSNLGVLFNQLSYKNTVDVYLHMKSDKQDSEQFMAI